MQRMLIIAYADLNPLPPRPVPAGPPNAKPREVEADEARGFSHGDAFTVSRIRCHDAAASRHGPLAQRPKGGRFFMRGW